MDDIFNQHNISSFGVINNYAQTNELGTKIVNVNIIIAVYVNNIR